MFVRKSTHEATVRQLDDAKALIGKQSANIRTLDTMLDSKRSTINALNADVRRLEREKREALDQLGKAWVRNARGRLERHPLNTETRK